jgi:hypothetical protein
VLRDKGQESMESQLTALEQRVARAEGRVNVAFGVAMTLMILLYLGTRNLTPGRIQAPLVVVDAQGRSIFQVDESPDGLQSHLRLFRPGGDHAAVLYAEEKGGGLDLFDRTGKPCAFLGVSGRGRGRGIYDRSGKPIALLATGAAGGGIVLMDPTGHPVASLTSANGGRLELRDRNGKIVVSAP